MFRQRILVYVWGVEMLCRRVAVNGGSVLMDRLCVLMHGGGVLVYRLCVLMNCRSVEVCCLRRALRGRDSLLCGVGKFGSRSPRASPIADPNQQQTNDQRQHSRSGSHFLQWQVYE